VELSLAEAAAEMGGWGRTASNLACGASTTAAAGMAGATEAEEQKEQGEEGEAAAAAAALSYKEFVVLSSATSKITRPPTASAPTFL
jgi:hypothetical protein